MKITALLMLILCGSVFVGAKDTQIKETETWKTIELKEGERLQVHLGDKGKSVASVNLVRKQDGWFVGVSADIETSVMIGNSAEGTWQQTVKADHDRMVDSDMDGIPDWSMAPLDQSQRKMLKKPAAVPLVKVDGTDNRWEAGGGFYEFLPKIMSYKQAGGK